MRMIHPVPSSPSSHDKEEKKEECVLSVAHVLCYMPCALGHVHVVSSLGRQIFVNHAQLVSYIRKQTAQFFTMQADIIKLSKAVSNRCTCAAKQCT